MILGDATLPTLYAIRKPDPVEARQREFAKEARDGEFLRKARKSDGAPLIKEIAIVTSHHFGYLQREVLAKNQSRGICRARRVIFYLCATLSKRKYTYIGETLGYDHSTVLYGFRELEKTIANGDAAVIETVEAIKEKLA
jgi:chromosomal replication initiation ATPase DnaA